MGKLPEALNPVPDDELRKELAREALQNHVDHYIYDNVQLDELRLMPGYDQQVNRQVQKVNETERMLDYLGQVTQQDPRELVVKRLEGILSLLARDYEVFEGILKVNNTDRKYLENIRNLVTNENFVLQASGQEEVEKFEKVAQERAELYQYLTQYMLFGKWCTPGKLVSEVPQNRGSKSDFLYMPLIAGRCITITINNFNSRQFPPLLKQPSATLPSLNGAFYYEQPEGSQNVRRIKCMPQSRELLEKVGTVRENIFQIDKAHEPQAQGELTIPAKARERLLRTLEWSGIEVSEVASEGVLLSIWKIMNHVKYHASGERIVRADEESNLKFLLDEWDKKRKFPGSSRSVAQIACALYRAIGFRARILNGLVVDFKAGKVTVNSWPEVYLPNIGVYIPADPTEDAFISYPQDRIYVLAGEVADGKRVTLKVDF